jgi:hypothetical protein
MEVRGAAQVVAVVLVEQALMDKALSAAMVAQVLHPPSRALP